VDPGEECDGRDLQGQRCDTLGSGYLSGTLACTDTCEIDESRCEGELGEILFLQDRAVWTIKRDGTGKAKVFDHGDDRILHPTMSPDGTKILYLNKPLEKYAYYDLTTRDHVEVASWGDNPFAGRWTGWKDDHTIWASWSLYDADTENHEGEGDIRMRGLTGDTWSTWVDPSVFGRKDVYNAAISPDGTTLAMAVVTPEEWTEEGEGAWSPTVDVFLVAADGQTDPRAAWEDPASHDQKDTGVMHKDHVPVWLGNDRLAWVRASQPDVADKQPGNLVVYDIPHGELEVVVAEVTNGAAAALAPLDERHVVVAACLAVSNYDLLVVNVDSGEVQNITNTENANERAPSATSSP